MDRNIPPEPDPPDIQSSPNLVSQNPLSQFTDVICRVTEIDVSQNSRKRPNIEETPIQAPPSKQSKSQIGRIRYLVLDKGPFIIHVSRIEDAPKAGRYHIISSELWKVFNGQ